MSFDSPPYNPFPEPAPDTAEPLEVFRAIATEHGLIRPGDPLDQNLVDAFTALVERAATIAEEYETENGNTGQHIRAVLYPN
ncbi:MULTISPECIES: hypothetical protein [unclassified Variovorax]|uniref:hypothetical protein n=1 Tax=unclassified Variovorax TaxID=663243 RepID=UPI00076D4EAF|nr:MULTISPECIES: hypothetical protein [unclassified Variovorax]KWT70850.1 hypothetical protein APY03_6606 [Variovorax sp. WDL1]PNG49219.1 hypothetical protein CHC06_06456 [Variovorax sp. B2]PNG49604.1 hypothetical protein CHC07_06513 [Variovorax sp. B4]VTV18726.1 hypothetical protein WDL1P2_00384 [Variovorax sp. WDL1]